jgi:transposase
VFRQRIQIVVIDPSAPYASGIRAALPGVKIAIDKWHLVALANTMVTEVRQRVTRSLLGRRGTARDSIWINRRLLLTGAEHLSSKQWKRLWRSFDSWSSGDRRWPPESMAHVMARAVLPRRGCATAAQKSPLTGPFGWSG